jgi:hypothetical protein
MLEILKQKELCLVAFTMLLAIFIGHWLDVRK